MEMSFGSWTHAGRPLPSPPSSATCPTASPPAAPCARPSSASPAPSRAPRWASPSPPRRHAAAREPALCDLAGVPEGELTARTLDELLHPEDRGADRAALDAMLAGKTRRLAIERRLVSPDGARSSPASTSRSSATPPARRCTSSRRSRTSRSAAGCSRRSPSRRPATRRCSPTCRTRRSSSSTPSCGCCWSRASSTAATATIGGDGGPRSSARCIQEPMLSRLEPALPRRAGRRGALLRPRARPAASRSGSRSCRCATPAAASSAGWPCGATSPRGSPPSAPWPSAPASSSAPTPSSSSSPTSPRTTCRSRCGWSRATCSCCGAATTGSSTRTPTSSSTTPSTAPARMRPLIDDLLAYSRAGRGDRPLEPVDHRARVARRVADDAPRGHRGPACPGRPDRRSCPTCWATSGSWASCSRT